MYKIIGVQRKVGEYEGHPYDNYILHCTYEAKDVQGVAVTTLKIKAERYNGEGIGDVVSPYYDQYRNIIMLNKFNGKE